MDEKSLEITACNNLKIFILDSVGTSGISLNSTSNLAHLESSLQKGMTKLTRLTIPLLGVMFLFLFRSILLSLVRLKSKAKMFITELVEVFLFA